MNVLVTGGAGFIGSHFIRELLSQDKWDKVINFDNLSYAGDLTRLKDIEKDNRYRFIKGDLRRRIDIKEAFGHNIDTVVHFAAETHVDNSIRDPFVFEEVNVRGTLNLLSCAREFKVKRFLQISTDEIYGDIIEGKFTESSPIKPNSPYSASKAAADLFVRAYIKTYNLPALIVRCCNNYGPWQYPEKFMPVIIYRAMKNEFIPVYNDGMNVREWLYVVDCAKGINVALEKGAIGEVYNIGSGVEMKNIDVAKRILGALDKPQELIQFVADRPGHDWRYALDYDKARRLGFEPETSFNEGIKATIAWSKDNFNWVEDKVKGLLDNWSKVYVKR